MKLLDLPHRPPASAKSVSGVRHVLLIVNPVSRRGRRALAPVLPALRDAGVAWEIAQTSAPRHATALIREHITINRGEFDAVFTIGGDGTAMEAMTALAELPDAPPLGIVAVGTANVLARTLGIPMSPVSAVISLLDATPTSIDLGFIAGGPAFAIGLGVGLDASMIGCASSALKKRIGFTAYAWSALRAGLRLERFHARVTVDGVVHVAETSSVLVANFGSVLGDMVCFGEDISHQDGLLDVCLYSPRSLAEAARIFWRMLFGGVSQDHRVQIIRGRHIRIETDPPRPMQADGELLGLTPVEIFIEPSAVRVLVPRTTPHRWRFRRAASARVRSEPLKSGAS
jgi:YegS/Rv2252/BmrU family lipid kinase